eukprot:988346-Amorphochlora_amoeboformis.AAC.1
MPRSSMAPVLPPKSSTTVVKNSQNWHLRGGELRLRMGNMLEDEKYEEEPIHLRSGTRCGPTGRSCS